MAFVTLELRDDGVALVRLDRPKANALSVALLEELAETVRTLVREPPGAVVVWGGERIFAAGADISEFGGPDEARRVSGHFRGALDELASIPRATIAAINGVAWRWRATSAWRPRTPASASPRSCSASSLAAGARSACRASSGRRAPRTSSFPAGR
jgi:hypothetical protein